MRKTTILQKFARKIKDLRKLNRMSQEQLAEKADLSPTYIGNLERGEQNPTLTSLEKIADALNVSPSELLVFPDEKSIKSAGAELLDKAAELLQVTLDIVQGHRRSKEK